MPRVWISGSFGDQDLLIASIETDEGRDIAVQSPSRGSQHFLQDRGAKFGKIECEILFVDEPGKDDPLSRFDAFRSLIMSGEPQIFVHPLIGAFRARAEGGKHSANAGEIRISYHCTFLPEDEPQPVFPAGAGAAPSAGVEAVTVAAATASGELAAAGLATGSAAAVSAAAIPVDCTAAVTSWSQAVDVDSQEVLVGVATLTGRINDAIDDLELATDIQRWGVYQAFVNLHFAVMSAGEAFTADAEHLISLRVDVPQPLLTICAGVYGGERAAERAPVVARLNRVRTPGRVPAGTVLKLPAPGAT